MRGAGRVLDLNCGGGELLIQLATAKKELVGVGLCPDAPVGAAGQCTDSGVPQLDKRLIAIPTAAVDALTDTRRAFDRAGISPQLWERFDCLLAIGLFSEQLAQDRQLAQAAWRAIPRAFSGASLRGEACASCRWPVIITQRNLNCWRRLPGRRCSRRSRAENLAGRAARHAAGGDEYGWGVFVRV